MHSGSVGLWSLVSGLWSCALLFAVLLFAGQNKTRRQLSLAAGYWRIVFARFGLSAQEHDRQPATVVVMPMSIVAVICSKHGSGFIPDEQPTCQIHLKGGCWCFVYHFPLHESLRSAPGNKRPRLDDVNLSLHVGPLDVLIAAAEDTLDRRRRTHQPPNYVVG